MSNVTALQTAEQSDESVSSTAMILNDANFSRVVKFAEMMASGRATVPKHLQGNVGDCLAVSMQAMRWRMDPFAVGQKTHLVNGTLGYEAQLVNAVAQESGAIAGRFHYEYRGEGANVECRAGAVLKGETDITWGEWLSAASVKVKNSPLWATNPKQQLAYLQVKNWARMYCPGAILGVYTTDELESIEPPRERFMGDAEVIEKPQQEKSASKTAAFKDRVGAGKRKDAEQKPVSLDVVLQAIAEASTREQMEEAAAHAARLNDADKAAAGDAYKARLAALKAAAQPADDRPTYAKIADQIQKAKDVDVLDIVADLLGEIEDATQRAELTEQYRDRRAQLAGE